jgi:hypothetical protein
LKTFLEEEENGNDKAAGESLLLSRKINAKMLLEKAKPQEKAIIIKPYQDSAHLHNKILLKLVETCLCLTLPHS